MKIFIYIVIVLVAIAIIAGFFVVGSPNQERLRKFDERRVQDLKSIQYQIINYWTSKSMLTSQLHDLEDSISGFKAPHDSVSGAEYIYNVKNAATLEFELCANFETSNLNSRDVYESLENWQHDMGMQCFARKIDPQLYPPKAIPKR